ncbi:MAG: ABC transporter substrate-binding protein [Halanaerobium sp.]
MFKKLSFISLVIVFSLLIVNISAVNLMAEDRTTIEYWHINAEHFGAGAVEEQIEVFEELNPEIEVISRYQEGSYGGIINNLQRDLAAGDAPVVAQIGYNFRLLVINEFPHKAIEDFKDVDPEYDDFIDGYIDGVLEPGRDGEGYQRGIPLAISVPVLYYNADLFREAGLDPDSPPTTWEELRSAALAIKEETGEYGLGIQISDSNNWLPQSMVESNGGWFLNPQGEIKVNSPEVIEVYKFWQEMALEDRSLPVITDRQQEQSFVGGRLGMYLKTSGALQNFAESSDFDFRTAQFPSWGDKQRRLASGGNALFIFAQDEEKQRAAYEFIKFLGSKEAQTIWVKGTGYLPLVKGVSEDPEYLGDFFAENPLMKPVQAQLGNAVPWLPFPGDRGFEAEQVLIDARQAILNGADVEGALTQSEALLQRLLD